MAKVVSSNQHILQQELEHIRKALFVCNSPLELSTIYLPNLTANIAPTVHTQPTGIIKTTQTTHCSNNKKISIGVTYIKSLSETFKRPAIT